MNWFGLQKGEGAVFFLLAIGMTISLIVSGVSWLSIDALRSEPATTGRHRTIDQPQTGQN